MQRKERSQIEAPATLRGWQSAHTRISASALPSQTLRDEHLGLTARGHSLRAHLPSHDGEGSLLLKFHFYFLCGTWFLVVLFYLLKRNPSSPVLRKIRDSDLGRECMASTGKPDHKAAGLWFLLSFSSPPCLSYTGKEKSVSSRAN